MFVVVVIMLGVGSAIGVSLLLVPNPLASLMLDIEPDHGGVPSYIDWSWLTCLFDV